MTIEKWIYIPLWHLLIWLRPYFLHRSIHLHSTMASINQRSRQHHVQGQRHLHSTMASINLYSNIGLCRTSHIYIPLWHLLIPGPQELSWGFFWYLHSTMASINLNTQHLNVICVSDLHSTMASINRIRSGFNPGWDRIYIPLWHLLIGPSSCSSEFFINLHSTMASINLSAGALILHI